MNDLAVSASQMREKFADYLERVETQGRVVVTRHGQERAYLISAQELRALEETIAVLENTDLMRSFARGLAQARSGRVRPAREAFAALDAEFDWE